jgi:hypothetical protein
MFMLNNATETETVRELQAPCVGGACRESRLLPRPLMDALARETGHVVHF